MQTVVLEGKKMEKGAGTASSDSRATSEGNDGPGSEEVEDPGSILRSKAQGRIFPGTSWFDGKHLRYKYVTKSTFKYVVKHKSAKLL